MTTYARVYQSVRDDERFAGVYEDEAVFGTWVKLLLNAERDWPAPSDIPAWCSPKAMKLLVANGIIEICPGSRFKVHGLDAERERRSQGASYAADSRWHDPVDPASIQNAKDPAVAYGNLSGSFPSQKAMSWLDDLTATYGPDAVIAALGAAAQGGRGGLIGRAQDALRAEARELSLRERAKEQERISQRREERMIERRVEWFKNTGQWDEGWGERPAA